MGALGIPLGPSEAVIAAIALGIGIDYSIHLISRVRANVKSGLVGEEAVMAAVMTTGRGILFNGVVVCAGFAVLTFSESPANFSFGLLIVGNMATCCIAALFYVPATLVRFGLGDADA
jgi:predicted RND superfamily exporter protein